MDKSIPTLDTAQRNLSVPLKSLLLAFAALALVSCGGGSGGGGGATVFFGSAPGGGSGGTTSTPQVTLTSISPSSGPTTGSTSVTVTGTNFPTTHSLTVTFGGTAATSVVVNSSTSATVTTPIHAAGTVDVVVTDTTTSSSATLTGAFTYFTPGAALAITTSSPLPDVLKGTAFNAQITAVGGGGTQTWSVISGSLPPGLTLNTSTGLISGTPTVAGGSIFTVQVTDATGTVSKQFTILVADTLVITTTSLPDAAQGGTYVQQITTTGGSGTQVWAISAGSLPPGLTINATTGLISGTPTTLGSFGFTVKVADEFQTASAPFTIDVNAPLRIGGGTQGLPYSFTPPPPGGGSVTWSVGAGGLPPGLSINSTDGTISGTPTTAGTFTVTLVATSGAGSTSQSGFLIVSPSSPAVGNTGNAYVGEVPANLDPAAVAVSGCQTLSVHTSYKLTANVGSDPTITCLSISGAGTRLDLNGFTVTGRIGMNADASGVSVFNGVVNCTWTDNGGDAGCVKILSQAAASGQLHLHHMTIHNSGGSSGSIGARSIHVDWAPTALATSIVVRIYNITSDVTNQPTVVRSHNINVTGANNVVEISLNNFTCGADGAACQGAVCDQVTDCRMHANNMNMIFNTTGFLFDSSRAMAFDTVATGEAWNNVITVNNNRAVRVRDSANIDVHDNVFNSIKNGTGSTTPYVAAVHLADPDAGTDDLNVTVQRNTFQIDSGMGIFIRNGIDVNVMNNTVTCTGGCTGAFAVLRQPQVIACAPGTVKPGLICDGVTYQTIVTFASNPTVGTAGLPSPQIQVAPNLPATTNTVVANVCKSGTAGAGPGGTGTINNSSGCP